MKRSVTAAIAFLLSVSLASPADAAITAGATCKKIGQSSKQLGVTYICQKSGTKLVWKKSLPTPKATPSPKASPTTSPAPTPTATQTSETANTKKIPQAPTSWSDVVQQSEGIAYWAWKKSAEKIEASTSKLGTIEILISPNAIPDNPKPLVALNLVSRFSAGYEEPQKVLMIYAGEKDIEWGQKQIDDFCTGQACGYDVSGEAKKQCNVPVTPCWGGVALRNQRTNIPMIYQTASDWGKTDTNHTSGTLEAHEYFHTVQATLLGNRGWTQVPRWLIEGGAVWAARAVVYSESFSKYEMDRSRDHAETLINKKQNASWIEKFLDPNYTSGWDQWNGNEYHPWAIYDVGGLASEALVSIGGPDKFLDLYKITGSGKTFAQAFESIYGISWREGVKIIANAIVAQQK